MFDIEEELKKLPSMPGVYIMHDKNDKIIYVGKAISLKNRVTSYFRKTNKTKRIENMVKLIDHFEYIVVDNEQEALILECNLIKKNMPKFNVLLKDDKTILMCILQEGLLMMVLDILGLMLVRLLQRKLLSLLKISFELEDVRSLDIMIVLVQIII